MVLLLDNYDSFTYNLYDYICQLGYSCKVIRNDEVSVAAIEEIENLKYVVLSPGPGEPKDAGILFDLIKTFYKKIPILGICLGHQAIGEFFGAKLKQASKPMHGKTSQLIFEKHYIFKDIKKDIKVMRYHSLILENLPHSLECIAKTKDNEIMALAHKTHPLVGIQFHPESILTEQGITMLKNFFEYHQ